MSQIVDILEKIFDGHPKNFNLRLWDGQTIAWDSHPAFTLIFSDKQALKKIILSGDAFTAGTAYIEKEIEIEGDIFEAIKLGDYLAGLKLSRGEKLAIFAKLFYL
jgi:cyclopropane-fatty-acyl-phospholipid synthase